MRSTQAVRVHEHLMARGDLTQSERDRAQHALALDYLKAGLLDRAEEALRKLEGTVHEGQALLALLASSVPATVVVATLSAALVVVAAVVAAQRVKV